MIGPLLLAATASGLGFLAVYVTGLVIGVYVPRHRRVISSFHAGIGVMAVLVFVARPAAITIATVPFRFSRREKAVLS